MKLAKADVEDFGNGCAYLQTHVFCPLHYWTKSAGPVADILASSVGVSNFWVSSKLKEAKQLRLRLRLKAEHWLWASIRAASKAFQSDATLALSPAAGVPGALPKTVEALPAPVGEALTPRPL